MNIRRILSVFLSASLCLSLLAGCGGAASSGSGSISGTADGPQRYSTVFYDAFDTVTQVIAYCDSEEDFNAQMTALHADLLEYHKLYDIYNDYDGIVNVKTINDNAGKAPVTVDDKILGMLELAQQIMVLRQQGVTHFSVACDYGVGLYAAELINVLRDNDPELMLFCVTPYEEQATKWTPELRERYFDMLVKCSHMTAVYTHKQPDAQLKAYRTIIRQSDMVLAVYDPASARGDDTDKAVSYARELHRPMLMIHPDTLKTTYSCVEV